MAFVATGTTITHTGIGSAEVLDISGPGISREAIDTTHLGTTTAKTYLNGKLYDGGEITVQVALLPSSIPGISSDASSCVIAWADSASSSWTFDAFVTGVEPAAEVEGKATSSITLKVTGAITVS